MDFKRFSQNTLGIAILSTALSACGGDKATPPPVDNTAPNTPSAISITSTNKGAITVTGFAEAGSTVTVTFPDGTQKTVKASSNGNINFAIKSISNQPEGMIKINSTDNADNTSKDAVVDSNTVIRTLYKSTGTMPKLSFKPSLGINTEGPQGGADTAGMPMPFVDIFRTARPFAELSPAGTQYDENGWATVFASGASFVRTKLLQGALDNSIPEGQYTVLYDGKGTLEFGSAGVVSNLKKVTGENKYTFNLNLRGFDGEDEVAASDTNAFNLNIRDNASSTSDYTKNIRIIMPGGTCSGNPFIRVDSNNECPNGSSKVSYLSVDVLIDGSF